ncbi:lipocalin/fatty acid-binding family protein [Pseudooctadecabacter jejudonensis]|uniref:Lipocalin-like domain-containing protein n=1 Tax=Pseudooctadecabacter jejudonensis TaxID=1391910 RepID=A0A1Y5RRN6_9RHOB|nr:lipocalin [Pseudooctadecabacter jejudonensis]SLN23345.1 hypothetical protein PSJ8397_00986 [Pseudooctadecabacter jejudonensis]
MRPLIIVAFAGLMACAEAAPPPADVSLLRNPTAPFASQVDVTAQDLDGSWRVRQSVGNFLATGMLVNFGVRDDQLILSPIPPADGLAPGDLPFFISFAFDQVGPGRWAGSSLLDSTEPDTFFWVLWMDFDRRTVALGDPDGTFVAILDRSATGGTDRIAAAREILDWYGYDLGQLAEQ